jgi:hypothetical protein
MGLAGGPVEEPGDGLTREENRTLCGFLKDIGLLD